MSSWIRGSKGKAFAKPVARPTFYSDLTGCTDIPSMYLNVLGTYIFAQRMGEPAIFVETTGLISNTLKFNPQLQIKDKPLENSSLINTDSIKNMTDAMVFSDIKKFASSIFQYTPLFNRSILDILEKASIKSVFDIGVHITCDSSGTQLPLYVNAIKEFQKRTRKQALSIYIKAASYSVVTQFQTLCDPSWKLTSLSKTPVTDFMQANLRELAEVQIFAVLNAAILDFSFPIDRYIFVMHRNPKGYEYFKEINNRPWTL
jgi:hypothetical protein